MPFVINLSLLLQLLLVVTFLRLCLPTCESEECLSLSNSPKEILHVAHKYISIDVIICVREMRGRCCGEREMTSML